jgi:hypothetical protein
MNERNKVYVKITAVHGFETSWIRQSIFVSRCAKTHLCASAISKISPGVIPPGRKGREREGGNLEGRAGKGR